MGRPMWPYDALWRFNVRATDKQAGAWEHAAKVKGLRTPLFLALAADVYSAHLERVHARWKRADERRKAREVNG